jgi:hypothetical protein
METLKFILEMIYFLSAPAIFIVAIIGLTQIRVTRENRRLSAKRDAFKMAAEQCRQYTAIIEEMNRLYLLTKEKNILFFKKSEVIITNNGIKVKPYTENNELEKIFSTECAIEITKIFNLLESLSLYFMSGIADINIGFITIGHAYVEHVKRYLPLIVPFAKDGDYQNIIMLFFTWNNRIEKSHLLKEKESIEEKINKNKSITINPIGTE